MWAEGCQCADVDQVQIALKRLIAFTIEFQQHSWKEEDMDALDEKLTIAIQLAKEAIIE